MHSATAFPDSERIKLLLAAGADPNGLNTFGGIVRKGPIALVHLSPLMLAASTGHPDTIAALLKAGARVNEVDIRKMNPLMLSIATDHANPDVVRQLISAGADANAKDLNGDSVLIGRISTRTRKSSRFCRPPALKGIHCRLRLSPPLIAGAQSVGSSAARASASRPFRLPIFS